VILLEEHVGRGAVGEHLVGALAYFGEGIGEKVGTETLIHGPPAPSAVVGAEDTHRRDSDPHPVASRWVQDDAVQAKAAETGLPLLPGRVAGQPADFAPGVSAILALEQGCGLHSGVGDARLVGPAGLHVPHLAHRGVSFGRAKAL